MRASPAASNFGWLVAERFGRLACNVVVGFVVARSLGPANFGRLNYALSLIAIATAVAEAGVANVVKREIASNPARAASTLAAAWTLRLIAGAVCYTAFLLWSVLGAEDPSGRVLLLIAGLMLFQPALGIADLWLQARLQARRATVAQLSAMVAGALMRLALVFMRAPLWAFAAAVVFEALVSILLLNGFARAQGLPRVRGIDLGAARRLASESWPLLLSGLMVMFYIRLDLVMLRRMAGETAAGEYAAAVRISELWFFVPGALTGSLLPALLRARGTDALTYRAQFQRVMDLNVAAAYALALPTVLLAPWIIAVAYGATYQPSAAVLAVHGWTMLWVALGVPRGQYCINEGFMRLHLASTTAAAGLNVALNLFLIPRYGIIGAAWATLAAQIVAAWGTSYCFAPLRECARMQTRALFVPLRWLFHVLRPI